MLGALGIACSEAPAGPGSTSDATESTGTSTAATADTTAAEDTIGEASTTASETTGVEPDVPRIEWGDCRFSLEEYEAAGLTPECGDLIVWENRRDPTREISLHFVRFPGPADTTRPPVVVVNGGPGGSTEGTILTRLPPFAVQVVTGSSDLVLYDQRGVGRSEPRLGCPLPFDRQASPHDLADAKRLALAQCRTEYEAAGVDLASYETRSSADDLAELTEVLGLDSVDLVALSYGTRLALEVMRRHPSRIHAAVLDAVVPSHVPYYLDFVGTFEQALALLVARCDADPACGAAYPDLETRFRAAAIELDETPLVLPNSGSVLTGTWLVNDVYESMLQAHRHGHLPDFIDAAAERDVARVEAFYAEYSSLLVPSAVDDANAMNRSVTCSDRWQYVDIDDVDVALAGVSPAVADRFRIFEFEYNLASCAEWPLARADPGFLEPVVSDVPVLLLSGELDPRTPPSTAEAAADFLTHAQLAVIAGGAHGVSADSCVLLSVLTFLSDPEATVTVECSIEPEFGA